MSACALWIAAWVRCLASSTRSLVSSLSVLIFSLLSFAIMVSSGVHGVPRKPHPKSHGGRLLRCASDDGRNRLDAIDDQIGLRHEHLDGRIAPLLERAMQRHEVRAQRRQ